MATILNITWNFQCLATSRADNFHFKSPSINDDVIIADPFEILVILLLRRPMLFNAPNLVVLDILEHHIAKH